MKCTRFHAIYRIDRPSIKVILKKMVQLSNAHHLTRDTENQLLNLTKTNYS